MIDGRREPCAVEEEIGGVDAVCKFRFVGCEHALLGRSCPKDVIDPIEDIERGVALF
jgi:hypothetical protein